MLYGGDVLFAGSIGRTDLPGGDHELLLRGIREKLLPLPDGGDRLSRARPGDDDCATSARATRFLT